MGVSSGASESLLPRAGGDGSLAMVIASTGVAVLGSFVFGVSVSSKIRIGLKHTCQHSFR
jgi:hypothetical protein